MTLLSPQRMIALCVFAPMLLASGCRQGTAEVVLEGEPPGRVTVVEEYWSEDQIRLRKHVTVTPEGEEIEHGLYTRWHPEGQKEYEVLFVMGRKHGTATFWHKNGRKWREEEYDHGEKHGLSAVWDEDGNKRKEERFSHGKPDGIWRTWDAEGRLKWESQFKDGEVVP